MQYRSIADLNETIVRNLHRVPSDVDLIVGIPRSGLLAATILALHLQKPLTYIAGLRDGRLLDGGARIENANDQLRVRGIRKALVIDDSYNKGGAMRQARLSLTDANLPFQILYGAVFVSSIAESDLDLAFEECPLPRIFEWNLMHHVYLEDTCVDIDGVLCRDPREEENDDGRAYLEFLSGVEPLRLSSKRMKALVTCRLEKYRPETEAWLARHRFNYESLVMLDLPSKEERQKWGKHGEYKGDVYRNLDAHLFIESSYAEAVTIADTSLKPVLCLEVQQMIYPGMRSLARGAARRIPQSVSRRAQRAASRLGQWMLRYLRNS